jgi:signal transduction histidine kinase
MKQQASKTGVLPDGRHLVKVIRVQEEDQITVLFGNSRGYSTLWLNLNDFACGVLYGILHCAGRPYQHYTNAEKLKDRSALIDMLTHELKTPLGTIQFSLATLKRAVTGDSESI